MLVLGETVVLVYMYTLVVLFFFFFIHIRYLTGAKLGLRVIRDNIASRLDAVPFSFPPPPPPPSKFQSLFG